MCDLVVPLLVTPPLIFGLQREGRIRKFSAQNKRFPLKGLRKLTHCSRRHRPFHERFAKREASTSVTHSPTKCGAQHFGVQHFGAQQRAGNERHGTKELGWMGSTHVLPKRK